MRLSALDPGNEERLQKLEGAGTAFLEASQQYNASSMAYFTDLAQVRVSTAPASPIDGPGGPGGVVELHTADAIGPAALLARATATTARAGVAAVTGRHALGAHTALRVSATGELGARAFDIPGDVDVDEDRRAAGVALRLEDRRGKDRLVVDGFGLVRGYVVPPIEDDTAEITQIDRELLGRASAQYERTLGRWQLLADAYGHGTTRRTHFFLDPTLTTPEALEDVRANRAGATAARLTTSPSAEWLAFPWLQPEIVRIPASDGVQVPPRRPPQRMQPAAAAGKAVQQQQAGGARRGLAAGRGRRAADRPAALQPAGERAGPRGRGGAGAGARGHRPAGRTDRCCAHSCRTIGALVD